MKMRIIRVPHRLFWPLVCAVAFFFCCVILTASPFYLSTLWVWLDTPEDFGIGAATNLSSDASSLTVAPDTFENFTCSASDSKEVIPPNIGQPFQEFLRYRHCRAFPILLNPSPCEDDLYLLLAIKSTAVQVDRRAALRETWGHAGLIQGRRVKLIFLMGRSVDQVQSHNLQPILNWESNNYGDILQWDFVDRFYNLTRKEDRFLSWFSNMCSTAQFVFKGDDDVFVNIENLVKLLSAHKPEDRLFIGHIHQRTFPIRDSNSKYFIPVEMYPNGQPYPLFPSGGGYLMSRQTVLGLGVAAEQVDLFPLDDVFLGMCLQQMSISLTHHTKFLTFGFSRSQDYFDPCVYRDIMLVHTLNPVELRVMWGLMNDNSLPCGS